MKASKAFAFAPSSRRSRARGRRRSHYYVEAAAQAATKKLAKAAYQWRALPDLKAASAKAWHHKNP